LTQSGSTAAGRGNQLLAEAVSKRKNSNPGGNTRPIIAGITYRSGGNYYEFTLFLMVKGINSTDSGFVSAF
jgi:hypothetical protein